MSLETKQKINKQAENKKKKSGTSLFVKIFIIFMTLAMLIPIFASLIFQLF